jgi:hypothetical protein
VGEAIIVILLCVLENMNMKKKREENIKVGLFAFKSCFEKKKKTQNFTLSVPVRSPRMC